MYTGTVMVSGNECGLTGELAVVDVRRVHIVQLAPRALHLKRYISVITTAH